jgi:hypothetical protein
MPDAARNVGAPDPGGVAGRYRRCLERVGLKPTDCSREAARTYVAWFGELGAAPLVVAETAGGGSEQAPFVPEPNDQQVGDPGWSKWPFNGVLQIHLMTESWCQEAVREVPGLTRRHEAEVRFMMRQLVGLSPASRFRRISLSGQFATGNMRPGSDSPRAHNRLSRRGEGAGRPSPDERPLRGQHTYGTAGRAGNRGHADSGRALSRPRLRD